MTKIPITQIPAATEKQEAIRKAVCVVRELPGLARIASIDDADALIALLSEPNVSAPIYTLPRPINRETITAFITRHLEERSRGEGLLLITPDPSGAAAAYHDIRFWPQWSACELGGAIHPNLQGAGGGGAGAATAFNWLFETIGVDLICETAALDNERTARLLGRLGFVEKGVIDSELHDGGTRRSRYWEMTKADWSARLDR